ncbi:MAG: hypothetical protein SGJ23_03005 [Alphaproteobacteria bacterium]|nr:hypothetical protein [Alphaproteobacteria bacterium]
MSEQSKGQGFRFGAIMTLVPLVTAAFGGLQYYRDQQQREFEAVTFYLQNQATFDPCQDAQLANLNLGMIENIYPKVYARVVEHVENRSSQCDSVTVISQEQAAHNTPAPAPVAPAPTTGDTPAAEEPAPVATPAPVPQTRQMRANIPAAAQQGTDFFRNRYDRMAALPSSSARRVKEGEYRVLIQISDEADRALAQSIEAALRDSGNSTPSIDLVPVRVDKAELRYFRESQAADAQKLADQIEQTLAAAGTPAEVTPSFVGRAGLPPGVMELWLP